MDGVAQMQRAIEEATEKVAREGYASAEVGQKEVILAGLGYVASRLDQRLTLVRVDGKRWFWAGVGLDLMAGVLLLLASGLLGV